MRPAALALLVLTTIAACSSGASAPPTTVPVSVATTRENPATITLNEYTRLQDSMSIAAAEDVIGGPGRILTESTTDTLRTAQIQWAGTDGSGSATLLFQADKLISRGQQGLK